MKTTLAKIRKESPCPDGWQKLLRHLGKTGADDEPLSLEVVLDSNGVRDAIWCLRAVDGCAREKRLFAVWCARQVQHYMRDKRCTKTLDVVDRYANGDATLEDIDAARDAAYAAAAAADAAATYAAYAATDAASDAACSAAFAADERGSEYQAAYDAARAAQAAELSRVIACIDAGQDPYPKVTK